MQIKTTTWYRFTPTKVATLKKKKKKKQKKANKEKEQVLGCRETGTLTAGGDPKRFSLWI